MKRMVLAQTAAAAMRPHPWVSRQGKRVPPLVFQGRCKTEMVDVYFAQVGLPALPPGSVIGLDNASFQQSLTTLNLVEAAGSHRRFLRACSPDLNPIEH